MAIGNAIGVPFGRHKPKIDEAWIKANALLYYNVNNEEFTSDTLTGLTNYGNLGTSYNLECNIDGLLVADKLKTDEYGDKCLSFAENTGVFRRNVIPHKDKDFTIICKYKFSGESVVSDGVDCYGIIFQAVDTYNIRPFMIMGQGPSSTSQTNKDRLYVSLYSDLNPISPTYNQTRFEDALYDYFGINSICLRPYNINGKEIEVSNTEYVQDKSRLVQFRFLGNLNSDYRAFFGDFYAFAYFDRTLTDEECQAVATIINGGFGVPPEYINEQWIRNNATTFIDPARSNLSNENASTILPNLGYYNVPISSNLKYTEQDGIVTDEDGTGFRCDGTLNYRFAQIGLCTFDEFTVIAKRKFRFDEYYREEDSTVRQWYRGNIAYLTNIGSTNRQVFYFDLFYTRVEELAEDAINQIVFYNCYSIINTNPSGMNMSKNNFSDYDYTTKYAWMTKSKFCGHKYTTDGQEWMINKSNYAHSNLVLCGTSTRPFFGTLYKFVLFPITLNETQIKKVTDVLEEVTTSSTGEQ